MVFNRIPGPPGVVLLLHFEHWSACRVGDCDSLSPPSQLRLPPSTSASPSSAWSSSWSLVRLVSVFQHYELQWPCVPASSVGREARSGATPAGAVEWEEHTGSISRAFLLRWRCGHPLSYTSEGWPPSGLLFSITWWQMFLLTDCLQANRSLHASQEHKVLMAKCSADHVTEPNMPKRNQDIISYTRTNTLKSSTSRFGYIFLASCLTLMHN